MKGWLLLLPLLTEPLQAEELPKSEFTIYLWDYEEGRDASLVSHLPKFQVSRRVRDALFHDYGNEEVKTLREEIATLADIKIVDDYEVVDSLPCPCYGLSQYDRPVEFGNFCERHPDTGVRDSLIFHDPVSFLKHLRFLVHLDRCTANGELPVGYVTHRERREWETEDNGIVKWHQETVSTSTYRPKFETFPPIRFRPDSTENREVRTEWTEDGVEYEETHRLTTHTIGETEELFFLGQIEAASGGEFLTARIRDKIRWQYDIFEPGSRHTLMLYNGSQVPCEFQEWLDDHTIRLTEGDVEIVVDFFRSAAEIAQPVSGERYNLKGEWTVRTELFTSLKKASP